MLNSVALKENKVLQIPATAITIGAMLLLPYLAHFLPSASAVPVGARLLPMFYAPLLAVIFFSPAVGIVASISAPIINYMLTGMPALELVIILSIELTFFSVLMQSLYRRFPKFGGLAPLAYLMAKVVSLVILMLAPSLISASPWQFFLNSTSTAWSGMVILLAINLIVVWAKRQSEQEYDGR